MSKSNSIDNEYKKLVSQRDRFSLTDLADILLKQDNLSMNQVERLRYMLYRDRQFFHDGMNFVKKSYFFNGSKFLISLTEKEMREGFLIPGHRWHPFVSRGLKPWEITFIDSLGETIPVEEKAVDWDSLKCYHLLLGDLDIFSQCQIKTNLFGQFFAEFPQYDLRNYLDDSNEKAELYCRVVDYHRGIVQLEKVQYESDINHEYEVRANEAFQVVFDQFGLSLTLPEQIEWAFYLGDPILLKYPSKAIAAVIHDSLGLSLYKVGLNTLLWRNDGSLERKLRGEQMFRQTHDMINEGLSMADEFFNLFSREENPFKNEALGPLVGMVKIYAQHFQSCFKAVENVNITPQGKEAELLITLTQYSHCLLGYLKELEITPPSRQEKEKALALLLENEGLLAGIMPFLDKCSVE